VSRVRVQCEGKPDAYVSEALAENRVASERAVWSPDHTYIVMLPKVAKPAEPRYAGSIQRGLSLRYGEELATQIRNGDPIALLIVSETRRTAMRGDSI
jgi:hypothetical protein